MKIELKPCPFCGGEAEMMGDQYPYVECQECGVNFSADHSYEFDDNDAASKWNARSAAGPKLKPIAESKVRQLGGDVCGVLVRKDGRLAAVDEHGRVQWLQDGQGVEPAGYLHNRPERIPRFFETLDDARLSGCEVVPVYTHPKPAQQGSVPEEEERLTDIYRRKLFECQDELNNLRSEYHNRMRELETEIEDLQEELQRVRRQHAQQWSVPEGWKLVPVEPTATMISAFEHAPCAENYTDAATWAWEAMLDAAPQPPQEGEGHE